MSVTIDSTLITGTNPDKHKIPGLVWYNEDEQRIINYGNGFFRNDEDWGFSGCSR